jgi:hypothetical protein
VDFVHVMEYLWKAAWCFYREGDTTAEVSSVVSAADLPARFHRPGAFATIIRTRKARKSMY